MEPDRYWFLYFGLLFVFLGSRAGQAICRIAFNLIRACFYMTLALLAGAAAGLLLVLSRLFRCLAYLVRGKQKAPDA